MRTCIPAGVLCSQDFCVFQWPRVTDDPETVFGAESKGGFVILTAPGYGEVGNYGNGSIYVKRERFTTKSSISIPHG